MQIFKGIAVAWQVLKWTVKLKGLFETKGASLITTEKCLGYRLWLERTAHALETGNTKGLPTVIQWLFKNTTLDNELGRAAKDVLKSDKLATGDEALTEPYQMH